MDYLIKIGLLIPFVTVLYFVADYFLNRLHNYIDLGSATAVMCQFGILEGFNIFLSIVVGGFLVNHLIDFAK